MRTMQTRSSCLLLQVNGEAAKSQARSCATKDPPFTEWWRTSWSRGATSPKVRRRVSPCALFRLPRGSSATFAHAFSFISSPFNLHRKWTRWRVDIRRLLWRYWPAIFRSLTLTQLLLAWARGKRRDACVSSGVKWWILNVPHVCWPPRLYAAAVFSERGAGFTAAISMESRNSRYWPSLCLKLSTYSFICRVVFCKMRR